MAKVLLNLCLTVMLAQAESSGPVVTLKTGSVRGHYRRVRGTDQLVEEYLGVPFAHPPLGPLRLAAPQPAEPWEGVRDATKMPNICPQDRTSMEAFWKSFPVKYPSVEVSEDCLYLNVYRPTGTPSGDKLPVMVWIHGGGLAAGGTFQYDGSPLAAYQNVVVVVIQYRLSILGFLSTGDEHAPGNWGFLDQIASLQWVHDNIEAFNGDPNSVTIFGQSAGGISVSMLVMSPLADGLFHKAIAMSGVAPLEAHYTNNPLAMAKMIANLTECDDSNNEKLVQCIKGKSEEDMLSAIKQMKAFLGPAIDGVFLKGPPEDILKSKEFQKVPMLIGVTNHEFGWILPHFLGPAGWSEGMEQQAVISVMDMFFPSHASGGNELILEEYLQHDDSPEKIRDAFTEILGDMVLVLPVLKVAAYHRDADAPVYVYEFQHSPVMHSETRPSFVKADHFDDALFFLGACFCTGHTVVTGPVTEEEEELSKTAMAYIANFAHTGSPNGPGLVDWPQYDRNENYLNLNLQQTAGQRLKQNRAHFLNVVLPHKLTMSHPVNDEL
ncbi:fatty acyl-CoA hydrolase precursor, medium chain-like [Centroberyx gerrardi]|uniref:fatty acyl-CoA hydrolase precursor, medium chain-like n=1 Tax=Centroberyx gerrardi TaxID=166262 RepID=UPI003AAD1C06